MGSALSRLWRERLPVIAVGVGTLTVLAGIVINLSGGGLGAVGAPFFVQVAPRASVYLIPAIPAFAAGLLLARVISRPSVPPPVFVAAVVGLTLILRLAVNAVRDGPAAWHAVFTTSFEAQEEYLPALPALRLGVRSFLDHFAEFSASLPIHPSAHPPGMLLTLHFLGITTGQAMAALTIGVGALTAPLAYALGRELLDEGRARTAALFYVFAPASLLYGATSADAMFAAPATTAALALVARRRLWQAVGPPLLALASFFSYALAAVGAWAALVVARRDGVGRATLLAAASGAGLVTTYGSLYAATGFDILGSLEAANGAYRRGIASDRPYWYWLFGSPTAFFVALGLPLAWGALRAAARSEPTAVALLAVVAISSLLGFTKAETERLWQFLVPLACLAAAAGPVRRRDAVLVLLALQALAVQLVLDTRW